MPALDRRGGDILATDLPQDYDDALSAFRHLNLALDDGARRAALAAQVGPLDVLVNNAATTSRREYEIERFSQVAQANLVAAADLCFLFARADLAFWNDDEAVTEPGLFDLWIATSSADGERKRSALIGRSIRACIQRTCSGQMMC